MVVCAAGLSAGGLVVLAAVAAELSVAVHEVVFEEFHILFGSEYLLDFGEALGAEFCGVVAAFGAGSLVFAGALFAAFFGELLYLCFLVGCQVEAVEAGECAALVGGAGFCFGAVRVGVRAAFGSCGEYGSCEEGGQASHGYCKNFLVHKFFLFFEDCLFRCFLHY